MTDSDPYAIRRVIESPIPGNDRGRYERSPEGLTAMRKEIEGIMDEITGRKLGKQYLAALEEREARREEWERLAWQREKREMKAAMEQHFADHATHSWLYGSRDVRCVVCHVSATDMKGPCRFGGPSL